MASDVSSGCTDVNEFFDDEKEEGEISLEDVSSSEEGQIYKYPPYRGQCPNCLSTKHCATWCRSLTVNKFNVKRDGGVQGKENRRNRHYDKEPAGVSNIQGKHAGLYSTLQEKNDDEGQNDLVPISSDSDMELVGLESTKKEKKHRKSHKKRRKKSPLSPDLTLALSIKESIHRLESGLFKKDPALKPSHSRMRYSPDKKSVMVLPPQRRHSRLSPVMMRPRRPRSPVLRKPSPPVRQRKPPPQLIPIAVSEEVTLPVEKTPSRGQVNKLLKKVRNLEPFSSRSKEKGSSLKDKLSNIIKSEKKDSSTEEISCKENRPVDTDAAKRDSSKSEIKSKESEKKKEKHKKREKQKESAKEKEKEMELNKSKIKEKERSKENSKEKAKEKEKANNKEREKVKEKEKDRIKDKEKVKENIKIKEEKVEENKSLEPVEDDDDDLVVLRQIALQTKPKRNTLLTPDEIKIEPIDHDEDEIMQESKFPKMPNFCMDDNDEDLQLRMIALRSAVIKKHRTRMQSGLKKKRTKNLQQKDQEPSTVPRMESPFTASFIDDFPLLAEICSPSSPLSKKDSLSVEDMVLDSDMELTAISDDESPYSPSDDIVCEVADSSLYTPSKPTETPCARRSNGNHRAIDLDGSFIEYVNQESRPYSPTDVTIYDPDLPGVHSNTKPPPVLALTPPQMVHPPPMHSTPPLQTTAPLQPPPLPPLSMFTAPVRVPDPMVLGCPPNMLNPFVDPTMANFPVNPMMLQPPQLFAPFPSMPPPAPTLSAPAPQLDDFGETDLDGSPLVPIEKDGQQQQQQWRLLNEPLYLQDLPPLGETHMNKMPMLTTPNLVPTAVLKSNKQLQKQPPRKPPANENMLFRNAEMIPVMIEPDVSKPCATFKPMKLQPSAKKNVPLQPAAAFNTTADDADSLMESQRNDLIAINPVENITNQSKSATPNPPDPKRKLTKRERRAAKRAAKRLRNQANYKEKMRAFNATSTKTNETEETKKTSDKRRRSSVDDDEDSLREILLASLAKRVKEQPDKAASTSKPSTSGAKSKTVDDAGASTVVDSVSDKKSKMEASYADVTNRLAASKSIATSTQISKKSAPVIKPTSSMVTTTTKTVETTPSTSSLEPTPRTSSPASPMSTSSVSEAATKTANNLKRSASAPLDSQPLSKIARKAASAKVVNNAKRYQNLLLQRKLAQEKNSKSPSTVSRFKVTNNGSLPQRSISPNIARLETNRLIINLNEDTESESERDEAKFSPTKERPQLLIPVTQFEMSLDQFLKCAREQHELAAATMTTTSDTAESVVEATAIPSPSEAEMCTSTSESTAVPSTSGTTAVPSTNETTTVPSTTETTASSTATEATANPSIAETSIITSTVKSTDTVLTISKASDAPIVTEPPAVVATTSKALEATVSTSKAVNASITTTKVSTNITRLKAATVNSASNTTPKVTTVLKVSTSNTVPKITTVTTAPIAKTSITTITKTNASAVPAKLGTGQAAADVKIATNTVSTNNSTPRIVKISNETVTDPSLTPVAVKHLPASRLEEYRRLKQKIYEYELLKQQKAKELRASASATTNSAIKKPAVDKPATTAPSSSTISPPSLKSLALASSTSTKLISKPTDEVVSESSVSVASTASVPVVSTSSDATVAKPSVTTVSKPPIAVASALPDEVTVKLTVVSNSSPSTSTVSVETSTASTTRTPVSVINTKPIVVNAEKSSKVVTRSASKQMVINTAPKSQLVATISPLAKTSRTETLSRTSPVVLISPTKIVHTTGTSTNLVKSVPNKTASVSHVASNRNIIANSGKAAISSSREIPQSTQESPTKLLDKMNAALKNQRLQISAVAHKVSSLRILTREQINHKSSQNQESTPNAGALNAPLTRINKEATSNSNSASKVPLEKPSVGTSINNQNKTSTKDNVKKSPEPSTSATTNSAKNSWEDFKHEVNNEVQSLVDLATHDQRHLLRDTEEKLINKRHAVLDDITEMSSSLRQWEIERDLQNMLSAEVKKLREQLRIAEEKMQQQKEKLNCIQPKVSSYHEKINVGRKECFRLSKICSGLGQQVIGSNYKVPTAGAELLNNRIKEVANHTQKLKSKKAQSRETLKNNNSLKTDKTKLKTNPNINNTNSKAKDLNNRQNNFNVEGASSASLPNNRNAPTNSIAKNIVRSEESATVSIYDSRTIKEEIVSDENSEEEVSDSNYNNDLTAQSKEKPINNRFLNSENICTDKPLNTANILNVNSTAERLNSNDDREQSTFSISNTQSENSFNSENRNISQNRNIELILNVNVNTASEKTNTESNSDKEISSREYFNESMDVEQSAAFNNENNVESENLNTEADTNFENAPGEINNQNLLTTVTNNICNTDNLNVRSEDSAENSYHIEESVNKDRVEQNATTDSVVDGASTSESDKNPENTTMDMSSVVNNVERTQQNELCFEPNSSKVSANIQRIKREPEMEMEVDSGAESNFESTVPHAENVENNNNTDDMEEFADSKLNEKIKESPAVSGTEHSTLLEEINLLEIANAVEVPCMLTPYSQLFKSKKRNYKSLKKIQNIKEEKKKKVPRPYESILKHLNAPRNNKTDGILCPYELMGTCYDGECQYVHQSTSHS